MPTHNPDFAREAEYAAFDAADKTFDHIEGCRNCGTNWDALCPVANKLLQEYRDSKGKALEAIRRLA